MPLAREEKTGAASKITFKNKDIIITVVISQKKQETKKNPENKKYNFIVRSKKVTIFFHTV